jgi:hypothetical protein
MSTAEWAISRVIPINDRLSVTMTCGPMGFVCEWSPTTPKELKKKERRRYRAGRDQLIAEVAARLGGNILLVEI